MTHFSYLVDLSALTAFDENNGVKSSWVHALPLGNYKHPVYGTISIDSEKATRYAESVNNKTRGIDPSINYNHNNQDIAAGWGKKAEARADGVWLFVEWTNDAATQIQEKKYKYFSAEYEDEWTDPQGNKHTNVIFGGALTNRPFMKNLAPINLSEETYNIAFDLVAAATGKSADDLKGGNSVGLSEEDLKKIIEGVSAKVVETKATTTEPTLAQKLSDMPELKTLAEENPLVKALIGAVETQNATLAENAAQLKTAEIAKKLTEFDTSKLVMTPVARQRVLKFAEALPNELHDAFWAILTDMKRSSSFLVELGEFTGATVNYGSPKSAQTQLEEAAKKLISESGGKKSFSEAYDEAVSQNPALYERYRVEMREEVR